MSTFRVRIAREEVAWLRWVIEAHDNLAILTGDGDGTIVVQTPTSRAGEVDAVLRDLEHEIPSLVRVRESPPPPREGGSPVRWG
jgi:hypothetical protein